jgi:hypothetical protein
VGVQGLPKAYRRERREQQLLPVGEFYACTRAPDGPHRQPNHTDDFDALVRLGAWRLGVNASASTARVLDTGVAR